MGSLSCSIISLAGDDSDGSVNDLYAASNSSSRSLSDSPSSLRMIVEASSRMRFYSLILGFLWAKRIEPLVGTLVGD